jgi:glycosyltransferase involved in cell wall biosynthesis
MKVSIIIPAKNEEAMIGRCLDSLRDMDWDEDDREIIVIDNGSVDGTVRTALEKGAQVHFKPGLTISALRNFGAENAKGDILAFLDADCTVMYDWLHQASLYFPREDVVCFGAPPVIPENPTWVQAAWFQVRRKRDPARETDWLESMNMFVRRDAFFSIGGFNEDLETCEDYDLSLRLRKLGKVISDEQIVAVHHGEAESVASFFLKEYWRGSGNLRGFLSHGFNLKEFPSVFFPIVHGILAVTVTFLVIAGIITAHGRMLSGSASLVIAWQIPLFLIALWKNRSSFQLSRTLQLGLLLNVYLLARGGAVFSRRCG